VKVSTVTSNAVSRHTGFRKQPGGLCVERHSTSNLNRTLSWGFRHTGGQPDERTDSDRHVGGLGPLCICPGKTGKSHPLRASASSSWNTLWQWLEDSLPLGPLNRCTFYSFSLECPLLPSTPPLKLLSPRSPLKFPGYTQRLHCHPPLTPVLIPVWFGPSICPADSTFSSLTGLLFCAVMHPGKGACGF
jgi:hypothetical protein